ncbi:hypothetical protein [Streptomyces acidiscabies]|uniref:Uncharacterized protein n=1 Tax=Streptomyces acidiscabies TaxID=42234 RepID=A0ABU4MB01_9ACTN|nr:hypothetical protein [Streptomyces acidiscabies]MDX3024976.1 hypothetical protein [Streptomyces acidiscabies]
MITHALPQGGCIAYDPRTQEFRWPIIVHRLDASTENTTLVLGPDEFGVLMVQVEPATARREKHLANPGAKEGR